MSDPSTSSSTSSDLSGPRTTPSTSAAPMTNLLYGFADELRIGQRMVSRGRTVTEADIVAWCASTGDWHRLHSDAAYAARSAFGQRIAPGLMVLAWAAGLGVPPDSEAILANYGADQVRFTAPVFIGDTLHLQAEVADLRPKRAGIDAVLTLAWNMVNQNGVMVMKSDLQVLIAAHARSREAAR